MDTIQTNVLSIAERLSKAKWIVLSVVSVASCSDGGAPKSIGEPAPPATPAVVTAETQAEPDSIVTALRPGPFHLEEATIAEIQQAIVTRQLTATQLMTMYLKRIQAYNGTCVNQPDGILGPISVIPHAGKLNALMTLNLRPQTRAAWGFDSRKARSQTDMVDDDPNMPDALEVAASLDAQFAQTGKLVGPLHGVVLAIKDQYNTFDMRTTAGGDAFYANDRPPRDATFVKRLRD